MPRRRPPPASRRFVIFLALTFCQGKFGAASAYWFYFAKTLAGAWLIWEMRPFVSEMRWAFSWEAVVGRRRNFCGLGRLGMDDIIRTLMKLGVSRSAGKSADAMESGRTIRHRLALVFHRWLPRDSWTQHSSCRRWRKFFTARFCIATSPNQNFLSVPLNQFLPLPFFATAAVFGFSHNEWLAGILCGAAYQWLVLRKNRLGDAMTAHAITNFLLGVWIVWSTRGISGDRRLIVILICDVRDAYQHSDHEYYFASMLMLLRSSVLPSCWARLASASL